MSGPDGGDVGAQKPAQGRVPLNLGLLFGTLYFAQGVGEPVEGLIAQPVRAILRSWGRGEAAIAGFAALLAIPWSLKPVYGLITDFVPLWGSRRRSYLILSGAAATAGLVLVTLAMPGPGRDGALLACLLVPTLGVAFADVVTDALMIERGQPLGITGPLQAIQWGAMYAATIGTGLVGGYLTEHGLERWAFAACAAMSGLTLTLALTCVREAAIGPRPAPGGAARRLGALARSRGLWGPAAFLFLWNFNPFSQTVLHLHMTGSLGYREQFYGQTVALLAVASLGACVVYGVFGRRIPMARLVHGSIVLGIAATLAYAALDGRPAVAAAITMAVGFFYMLATLIQLDLAARVCPPEVAGTAFATLMALENLANASSTWVGGGLYEWGSRRWGAGIAFDVLVLVGATTTALCWLVVPWLPIGVGGPRSGTWHTGDRRVP